MAETFKTKPKILFGPGRFRAQGGEWVDKSEADCAEMVRNFNELAARGEFPSVTLGHPSSAAAPKLGVLHEAWWDPAGNCITGPLDDVNPGLAEAIEAGEYDKVSIVFADNWWDPVAGRHRNNVITEVGVLGAKWGAFRPQPDKLTIAHPMAEAGGKGVRVYQLSMADIEEAPDEGGGEDVEDKERKELEAKIEALVAKVKELEAAQPDEEKDALEAKVADLTEKLELATKAQKAAAEKIADAEVKAKEDVVDGVLKEAVTADKDGNVHMTPAEAEVQKAVLMAMDDTKTVKLSDADGKEVEKSLFEVALEGVRNRGIVLKLSEKSVDGSDGLHKGKEKDEHRLTEMEADVAKRCGLDPKEVERTNAPDYDVHADAAAADAEREKKA